jgi:ribonuclease HI
VFYAFGIALKSGCDKKRQMWRPKDKPDESGRSAHRCMVCFLPNEFMDPANQIVQEETLLDVDEAEKVGLMAQLMLAKQATFDKPAKNRHMRLLSLRGLQYLREAKAIALEIYGNSDLVIKQLNGQYECRNDILRDYYEECKEILKSFQLIILQHIPRESNREANRLAQSASGYRENQEVFAIDVYACGSDLAEHDWRKEIVDYLENPARKVSRKPRYKAIKFVLLDGRLHYKSMNWVLLQCRG